MLQFAPETLLIDSSVYIPDRFGVRVHNGDKIICDIVSESADCFVVEANGIGESGKKRVEVPRSLVRAVFRRGAKDWDFLCNSAR